MFQLIAAEILELIVDEDDGKARLSIKVIGDEHEPACVINSCWDKMTMVATNECVTS